MKLRFTLIIAALALVAATASAQGRKSLRINEVMVANDSSVVDDYGYRNGWVELFNSTFAPLEISSVFITDDPAQPRKYPVPLGDVNTRIPKRQHVIFWADGEPSRGTFHMNFRLKPGQPNYIGVYDADGSLIDEITVPATLQPGQTYARRTDGLGGEDAWEVRPCVSADGVEYFVTPSSNNVITDTNRKVESFAERDENGFAMTIMAMAVVFSALLLLSVCFYIISKIGERVSESNKVKSQGKTLSEISREERPGNDSGEVIAAIAMALHDHLDAHDRESAVLTINKVRRAYSPWSSKIYSMRHDPRL